MRVTITYLILVAIWSLAGCSPGQGKAVITHSTGKGEYDSSGLVEKDTESGLMAKRGQISVDLSSPKRTWNSFIETVRDGDWTSASQCVSEDLKDMCRERFDVNVSFYRNSTFEIIGQEDYPSLNCSRLLIKTTTDGEESLGWMKFGKKGDEYVIVGNRWLTKDWSVRETNRFVYHYSGNLSDALGGTEADIECLERLYDKACNLLGVSLDKKIEYYLCPTFKELFVLTNVLDYRRYGHKEPIPYVRPLGYGGLTYPESNVVYSILVSDNKAVVKLLVYKLGNPPLLFSEGLVNYFSTINHKLKGENDHEVVQLLLNDKFIPLKSIVADEDFRKYDASVTELESESFVRFLIERYGMPKFKDFCNRAGKKDFDEVLASTYGKFLGELSQEWIRSLQR